MNYRRLASSLLASMVVVLIAVQWKIARSAAGISSQTPAVHALFDVGSPERSPFPSDRFTVSDDAQNTGRRVNLPLPADCSATPTDCEEIIQLVNILDGFNPDPWLSIPFDGDLDVRTIKGNIILVSLGDTMRAGNVDAAIQEMAARFFESDGAIISQTSPYFEAPMKNPVPEDGGYIR